MCPHSSSLVCVFPVGQSQGRPNRTATQPGAGPAQRVLGEPSATNATAPLRDWGLWPQMGLGGGDTVGT